MSPRLVMALLWFAALTLAWAAEAARRFQSTPAASTRRSLGRSRSAPPTPRRSAWPTATSTRWRCSRPGARRGRRRDQERARRLRRRHPRQQLRRLLAAVQAGTALRWWRRRRRLRAVRQRAQQRANGAVPGDLQDQRALAAAAPTRRRTQARLLRSARARRWEAR